MKKLIQNTIIILVVFTTFKSAYSQSLSYNDLKDGEVYYITYKYNYCDFNLCLTRSTPGSEPKKSEKRYDEIGNVIFFNSTSGNQVSLHFKNKGQGSFNQHGTVNISAYFNDKAYQSPTIRKATTDERHWLEICIDENKFISKEEARNKISSKNKGQSLSATINLNRTALDATYHGIQKEGWQFTNVPFRYQFVNCGGEVQMGVQYDRQADFITLVHNGSVYNKAHAPDLWPKSSQIEVGDVIAKLYYGNQYFGDVKLTYIVGNFAGCFGETFDVLKQVGKNPSQKDFLGNLDKFSLKDIRILRGDVTINYEKKQQIIKAVSYDAFGNPINSKSPNQNQPKTDPNQNTKYDAFGNPIKNNSAANNAVKKEETPNDKPKQQYDAFGNPIKVNSQNTKSQTVNSKSTNQQKTTSQTQEKVYFLAYAFNRNVGGCSIKINNYIGYVVYEGKLGDYMKAVEAVKAKYPDAEEYSASDFYPGKNFVLLEVYLLERPFSKSEGSCKRTAYEMFNDSSLEDAMSKIKNRYGTSIIHTKVLINKTF